MKNKRIISLMLCILTAASLFIACLTAFGNDVTWQYDSDSKTLYIHGTSAMPDYADEFSAPWNSYVKSVETIVIDDGITNIGAYAFSGMSKLTDIVIPESVASLGAHCLSSCSSLKELTLGANVREIADDEFAKDGLTKKADFVLNTFAGTYALHFAVENEIAFSAPSVPCASYKVDIKPAGMKAYYPYTAKVDGTFTFYTVGNYDTIGYLFDESFNQLVKNDDSPTSTNFSITAELEKGKTYYIKAGMLSNGLEGSFNLVIEAKSFNARCEIKAMFDPSGTASDIDVQGVLVDGQSVNGSLSLSVDGSSVTKIFQYKNQTQEVTFTPDGSFTVVFMTCDLNEDKWVNAKDFALMKKENSPYIHLFEKFINYHY